MPNSQLLVSGMATFLKEVSEFNTVMIKHKKSSVLYQFDGDSITTAYLDPNDPLMVLVENVPKSIVAKARHFYKMRRLFK
jgi:hypothetical protein